jgi:hypothetical protein
MSEISEDQIDAARDAQIVALRKQKALAQLCSALRATKIELLNQSRRLTTVRGKTATETLALQELSIEYENAAKSVSKLIGYQMGRLERMNAEMQGTLKPESFASQRAVIDDE